MIDKALIFVQEKLNSHLRIRLGLDEDKVVLSAIVGQDGRMELQEENKIICSLVSIEKENIVRNHQFFKNTSGGDTAYMNPPLNLNLHILFISYFSRTNYKEALKMLSAIISFFQANSVFTHQNSPEMDDDLDMLVMEILEQNQHDKTHMWSMIGAKYMPSVVYKLKMLTYESQMLSKVVPVTKGSNNNIGSNK